MIAFVQRVYNLEGLWYSSTTTKGQNMCEYFALCVRPAAGVTAHPVLTWVPTCRECAARFDLELH